MKCSPVVLLMVTFLGAGSSRADVIADTFGPDDTYRPWGIGTEFIMAVDFVPQTSAILEEIRVPLSGAAAVTAQVVVMRGKYQPETVETALFFQYQPDEPITVLHLPPAKQPILYAGTRYYLLVNTTLAGSLTWHDSFATFSEQFLVKVDGMWFPFYSTRPAYRLSGPTPLAPLQAAEDAVGEAVYQGGLRQRLLASLHAARRTLTDGRARNDVAACGQLQAFMNKVQAQRGRQISERDAQRLLDLAQETTALIVALLPD